MFELQRDNKTSYFPFIGECWFISNSKEMSDDEDMNTNRKMIEQRSLELPDCKDDKFLQVLVHFRIANPEDLFILAMKECRANFCRELTVGTDKVTQYLKHCSMTPSQELYLKLISGLNVLKQKLCDDNDFNQLFKRNTECYNTVQYLTEPCWGPQDWLELKNTSECCKTMKTVLGCFYVKTLLNCGLTAAEVFNDLMKAVMISVSDNACSNIMQENYVRDLRSSSESSSSVLTPNNILSILCYTIILARI